MTHLQIKNSPKVFRNDKLSLGFSQACVESQNILRILSHNVLKWTERVLSVNQQQEFEDFKLSFVLTSNQSERENMLKVW